MCGIAGFTGGERPSLLQAMADAIRHRGPDGEGFHYCPKNGVSLAHRRLSITDIAGGHQPMWNEDDSVGIVFNGEIYNHLELRQELARAGHRFKSDHSDTEVLVHGYEEWGEALLARLNGMFAFCIYDRPRKRLFLARDRFGKKPLYYSLTPLGMVFASELKALLIHPGVSRNLDPLALRKYFAYGFIPAPYSLYQDVRKLPGGHYMVHDLSTGSILSRRYWRFEMNPDPVLARTSVEGLAEELRSRIGRAVRRRLVADVPVGIFLSGGIDSSTVLACATEGAAAGQIRTFSIGFHEKEFDEADQAREIARHFGADHSEEIMSVEAVRSLAHHVLGMLDEPMADSSILPTFLLARFARRSVTVALGGDGGDELFAGYAPFRALRASKIYCDVLPQFARTNLRRLVDLLPASDGYLSLDFKLKRTLQGLEYPPSVWNPIWLSPLRPDEIAELLGTPVSWEEVYADAIGAWNDSSGKDLIARTSEFYGRFYLQDGVLTKVDRASMMVGLEVRAPFLDNEVVDLATRLPSTLKYRRGTTKYLLKQAMRSVLPHELLTRPKKGFGIPLTKWLKSWPLPTSNALQYNGAFASKMAAEHSHGRRDNRLFLWAWLVMMNHLNRMPEPGA